MNTKVAIFIAIILAIFSAIAVRMYIQDIEDKEDSKWQLINVLVAKSNLKAGQPLQAKDLDQKPIPMVMYDRGNMFTANDSQKLIGSQQQIYYDVKQGTILLQSYIKEVGSGYVSVTDPNTYQLGAKLKPSERTVTLKVDALSGAAMLLRPKEFVDIYWSGDLDQEMAAKLGLKISPGKRTESVTFMLLSDVNIMALDNRYSNSPSVKRGKVVATKEAYSSVTVVCRNWEEAKMLIYAQNVGKLTLVKKGNDNQVIDDDPGVTSDNFIDLVRKSNTIRKSGR